MTLTLSYPCSARFVEDFSGRPLISTGFHHVSGSWTFRLFLGWACDGVWLTRMAFAEITCTFDSRGERFARGRLGRRRGKDTLELLDGGRRLHDVAGEYRVPWERTLSRRLLKANGVFANWRPLLTASDIPMSDKIPAITTSVVNSSLWQAGNWTLTAAEFVKLVASCESPQTVSHV